MRKNVSDVRYASKPVAMEETAPFKNLDSREYQGHKKKVQLLNPNFYLPLFAPILVYPFYFDFGNPV